MNESTELIYVGDPLCSWCYGVAEEIHNLKNHYADTIPFRTVVGGLRTHVTEPMDARMKSFLRHHWEAVQERTGQPFNYDLVDGDASFIYDTEKPCRAVVAFRHLKPEATLDFFKSVQKAFYRDNQDTNEMTTYHPLLEPYQIDPEEFDQLFQQETIRKETNDDFMWARQVGVSSFPTMLLWHEKTMWAVAVGYRPFENMRVITERILNGEEPVKG